MKTDSFASRIINFENWFFVVLASSGGINFSDTEKKNLVNKQRFFIAYKTIARKMKQENTFVELTKSCG